MTSYALILFLVFAQAPDQKITKPVTVIQPPSMTVWTTPNQQRAWDRSGIGEVYYETDTTVVTANGERYTVQGVLVKDHQDGPIVAALVRIYSNEGRYPAKQVVIYDDQPDGLVDRLLFGAQPAPGINYAMILHRTHADLESLLGYKVSTLDTEPVRLVDSPFSERVAEVERMMGSADRVLARLRNQQQLDSVADELLNIAGFTVPNPAILRRVATPKAYATRKAASKPKTRVTKRGGKGKARGRTTKPRRSRKRH